MLSRSTYWLYLNTNQPTVYFQSSSICTCNSWSTLRILKYTDPSLSDIDLIFLQSLWICISLEWCACCNAGQKIGSCWQFWRCNRWALHVFCCLLEVDSKLKPLKSQYHTSAKNISVRAEWLRQSGHALSEPSETPRWWINPRPASIPRITLHITLRSLFRRFFLLCWSPILNKHSGVVANCDHTSEWVHWVHACIGIAMQWVTLRQSLLTFLLH